LLTTVLFLELEVRGRREILYSALMIYLPGADPGFQVRGGALKKNCAERREARKFLGYFV
jgi:hypothetical protein